MKSKIINSILLFIGLIVFTDALSCVGKAKLQLVVRDTSLEADYARGVFLYHGGTAYFVGGNPGYFITAYHVLEKKDPNKPDKVCSRFVVVNIDKTDRNRPVSQDVFQGLTKNIIQISSTPIFVRTYSLQ